MTARTVSLIALAALLDSVPAGAELVVPTDVAEFEEHVRPFLSRHCARCHGSGGLGDGDAAKGLSPSPALLAFMIQRPLAIDEYLLWTVSEGGAQFGTAMPAFKATLSELQIWQIVGYMRAGFPPPDPGD